MSAIIIDSGVVHYEYLGRGCPVIFIHGWVGSWRYWMPAMNELASAYRTYAVDLWGFGDTDKMQSRYTLAEYVQLLRAFMHELGISHSPLIVGHALGALVALHLALAHPDRVERLVLISLPLDRKDVNEQALLNGRSIPTGAIFREHSTYEPIWREMEKTDRQAIAASLAFLSGVDVPARLASLQVPTLLLHGVKDETVTFSSRGLASTLEAVRAGRSFVWPMPIPQARHFPMLEETSVFNRLLRDFLLLDMSVPDAVHSLTLKEEWRRKMR